MHIKMRNAELEDTEFILSGIKDILTIEKCVFDDRVYRERKKLTEDAIKNKQVRVAFRGDESVGFSWFKISDLTHLAWVTESGVESTAGFLLYM